ncbi:nucleic acid-binding, OB-fold protein [Artemisia annua]|uniref:Nucleic acid-binding, OB-fold protein n=1 Tax=Artemisia annua TaxID=35608 RepID=A0A2U1LNF0_ARTAN|nr:nucleic acid-binding, OB-fold protein [Artemisia annua]
MGVQNGYNATRLFLFSGKESITASEFKAVDDFRQLLLAKKADDTSEHTVSRISTASKYSTKEDFTTSSEMRHIVELLDVPQGKPSVIVGTIIAICEDEGWWYLSCGKCKKKVVKTTDIVDLEADTPPKPVGGPTEWWCSKCGAVVTSLKTQFRLQIRVQDATGTCSVSLFNDEVLAFADRSAYQLQDKYAKCKKKVVKTTDIVDLEADTPPKPVGGPTEWWCSKCGAVVTSLKTQFRLQIRVQNATGTCSVSLFNDEVLAFADRSAYQLQDKYAKVTDSDFVPPEIKSIVGSKFSFKVVMDSYNSKKLLPVFNVMRMSADKEIIESLQASATPIKQADNEATSGSVPVITPFMDDNTTPTNADKSGLTNKRPADDEADVSMSSNGKKAVVHVKVAKNLNINEVHSRLKLGIRQTYVYKLSFHEWGVAPPTIDVCIHHGGRVVTTNVLYDYWGGDELMICNVSRDDLTYTTMRRLVSQHLPQYTDVCAYYLRVPTVQMKEQDSLRKIEHEWYIDAWLSQIQVGHSLDIYLAHRRYPTLIDPNRQRWLERRWEQNGWISGHVEANRRAAHTRIR